MYKIRKLFEFEMAHILDSSFSKECQRVHGHSYKLEVIISRQSLNKDGMVMDFKKLKKIVKKLIIEDFDHTMVINEKGKWAPEFGHLSKSIKYVNYNPTAENMAEHFHSILYEALINGMPGLMKLSIRLHETRTGWVEYTVH